MILNGSANRFERLPIHLYAICIILTLWASIREAEGEVDVCKELQGARLIDTVGLDFEVDPGRFLKPKISVCRYSHTETDPKEIVHVDCAEPCRGTHTTCKGTLREVPRGKDLDIRVIQI